MKNRPCRFPQLRNHQEIISTTAFMFPPLFSSLEKLTILRPPLRNVVEVNKKFKTHKLCVRVFVRQNLVTLAYCGLGQLGNAVRVADLATLYFWKYRLRGPAEPPRDFFNLSIEQATTDLERETVHRDLLTAYEEILRSLRLLPTEEELKRPAAERQSKQTVRATAAAILSELRQATIMLRGENLGITTKISQLTSAVLELARQLKEK